MLTRADAIALLKVLIAAGWADGRLTQSELNYVKTLAQRFRVAETDWLELQPHIEDPPTDAEVGLMFRDLLERIATPGMRSEVIGHLTEILNADAQMTAEEHDFLDQYTRVLREASTLDLLVGRMKGFFKKPQTQNALDLDEFIRNKILFKLRRRLESNDITPEMHRLCILGGLMGIVAHADGTFDGRESEEIRRRLQNQGSFSPDALDVLVTIIEEESVRGLDRARLISELVGNATFEEKSATLDLLFAVATADGNLTHAELEILRSISAGMNLSHRQYIATKVKSRQV